MPISFVQKKFIAKLRLSTLALQIKTGRYERPRLLAQNRLCLSCENGLSVENEEHFIFSCLKYNNLRESWINQLKKPENFANLDTSEKFKIIFDQPENVKISAQYIINCYDVRSKILFL